MKHLLSMPILLVLVLVLAACAPAATAPAGSTVESAATEPAAADMATEAPAEESTEAMAADIVDTAVAAGGFTKLVEAVQAAGLVDTLKGEGPFTVFAPTDDAFAALPEGTFEALAADPENLLVPILLYHVVPGKVMAADVSDGMEAETAQGGTVTFTVADGKVMINDAEIVATDIEATNGVIHVIDKVILPPSDEAASETPADEMPGTIPEVAAAAGNFSSLLTAVEAAGLGEALSGEGPFTVFAPTDEAFAALPEGTFEALAADPENLLTPILLYHVIPGKVMAADVVDGLEAETLQGSQVRFTVADGKVMIDGANIVATDIPASNGVIHVIDAVIQPPSAQE